MRSVQVRRWKTLLLVLVISPFFTSFLLRTLSWQLLLADDGFIVDVLQFLQILGDDGRLLATPFAVILGLAYTFLRSWCCLTRHHTRSSRG